MGNILSGVHSIQNDPDLYNGYKLISPSIVLYDVTYVHLCIAVLSLKMSLWNGSTSKGDSVFKEMQ